MYHELIIDSFKRFKIYYKNQEIIFENLEEFINKNINEQKEGNNIFIMPKDNDYLLITQIIYNSINYSLHNIFESNEDILDVIKIGDTVEYNKALACFEGVENKYIVLKFKDGTIRFPLNLRYKISKYNGDAMILNKMPNKIISNTKKTKSLLSEILNIEALEICKEIKKTILIVANKDKVNDIIKYLEIKVGEHSRVSISEVFTMAYYSSKDNCHFYKGNSKKEEPLLKFTSKTYIAKDLVRTNKKINSIVFIPKKVINEDLIDLVQIYKRKTIENIFTIVNPIDIERRINDDFIENGFKIKEIKFNDLNLLSTDLYKKKQMYFINNYNNGLFKYNIINEILITKSRNQMNKSCKSLLNNFQEDNDIARYIITARRLCKRLTSVLIPLSEYERITKIYGKNEFTIEYCNDDLYSQNSQLKIRNLNDDAIRNIEMIWQCIQEIYYEINKCNCKWDKLNEIIKFSLGQKSSLIIENKHMRNVTKHYIRERFPNKYNLVIEDINSNKGKLYDTTLIGGILDENLYCNYKRYNSNNVIVLGYRYENQFYKLSEKRYMKFVKNNIEIDLVEIDESTIVGDVSEEAEIDSSIHLENEIESLIAIRYIPDVKVGGGYSQEQTKCEAVLIFTNGKKAFITQQYNAYVINENKEELMQKKLKDLRAGDILIFIEGIERDLVDTIIQQLMSLKEIKEAYSNDYNLSKEWKKILKEYSNKNKFTLRDLSEKLKLLGISRESATIRSWIIDAIVGPQEEEVYEAIGKLTQSEFIINNYKKIFESCNNIRRLQIKVRKAIVKSLLKDNNLETLDNIDELIMRNINNGINYVNQVEIQNIYKVNKEVPIYITNRVLEV